MSSSAPPLSRRRAVVSTVLGFVILACVTAGLLVAQAAASRPASSATIDAGAAPGDSAAAAPANAPAAPPSGAGDGLTHADGVLPDGADVGDRSLAGIANLDPALLSALEAAGSAAAGDGIRILVTSGWRSPALQKQLLRDAVAQYGSEAEAARWVASAETSLHVAGDAVDIGSYDAMDWLAEHGAAYGLCRVYDNEPWHFELVASAPDDGCPGLYADPTRDPRLQR
ncbi:hypothetical protein JOD63_003169 [Microbacterium terrae]|uniref:D-alanyl-D-alanine carboxypeptidase n=1 Tax=Microbacterium terrae TaxID=69369 RepID=A0A0M2H8L2_9MICO|nr:M15 family metallopeptidase [Microbacterium terrae]KJL40474.1 D-alanyl-D-alanine carboxypeptidase [Microbacterium terrae]MBP1079201.1 hypothetical protein [Microbacterium terrae]GLJ98601.1 hypothetical protein GCM10017594_17980 [Microbacterium terrae]